MHIDYHLLSPCVEMWNTVLHHELKVKMLFESIKCFINAANSVEQQLRLSIKPRTTKIVFFLFIFVRSRCSRDNYLSFCFFKKQIYFHRFFSLFLSLTPKKSFFEFSWNLISSQEIWFLFCYCKHYIRELSK